jgi:hypothetical protein
MKTAHEPIFHYINDFFYIVIIPLKEHGPDTFAYCSGVNTQRFYPLTRDTHGIGSNPAVRGLQLTRSDIISALLKKGAKPKTVKVKACENIGSITGVWYTENMIIENVSQSLLTEIIPSFVMKLISRIVKTCIPDASVPEKLPLEPKELENFLNLLSERHTI